MVLKQKNRYKPLYKQFLRLRDNIQDKKKLLKFKKKKWQSFIQNYKRKLKRYNKFKPYNPNRYIVSKYPSRFSSYRKRFRTTLLSIKTISLFYGKLSRKYIKQQLATLKKKKNSKNLKLLFLEFFERRLDTILYRSKFSPSIRNARQLISHGIISVNNKPVRIKSYELKTGDLITVNPKYSNLIKVNLKKSEIWPIPPKYLTINYKTMQIVLNDMKHTNFSLKFDLEKLIANYY